MQMCISSSYKFTIYRLEIAYKRLLEPQIFTLQM